MFGLIVASFKAGTSVFSMGFRTASEASFGGIGALNSSSFGVKGNTAASAARRKVGTNS